jgi:hypothetical protein
VRRLSIRIAVAFAAFVLCGAPAFAQDDDPAVLNLAQPDFTLVSLPTSLRVPTLKGAFRVTHRFGRSLGEGDFGDLAGDLFGLDNGAVIGLEYRFGIVPNGQIGMHRSSFDKTFSFFADYSVTRQPASPVDVAVHVSIDGQDNFQENFAPAVGAIVSRRFAETAAVYVEPIWVGNTNPLDVGDDSTLIVGLGVRVRIRPTVYLVGEAAPRVTGFDPGVNHGSFAIEKRVGGHLFQLNFSNSFSTTMGQIARGGFTNDDWYMGFNISRKFY